MIRKLATLALALVLIFTAGLGVVLWLGGREAGLHWILSQAVQMSDGALTVDGAKGSLYGPLRIGRIAFESATLRADIEDLELDWSPRLLRQRRVVVSHVRIANLHLTKKGKEQKEAEPFTLPESLELPVAVEVREASIGRLTLTKDGSDHSLAGLEAKLQRDAAAYTLSLSARSTPLGAFQGEIHLGTAQPFPINGSLVLSRAEVSPGYQAKSLVSGDLTRLRITATAEAEGSSARGYALVNPLAQMPLARLEVQANAIDPARLRAGAPTAEITLSLKAESDPAGAITGTMKLDNARPGTWEEKRLPLKTVSAELSGDMRLLRLTDVDLDLAKAGQFFGQGSIEQGTVRFSMATDNFNLQGLQANLKPTRLAGDIRLNTQAEARSVHVDLGQDEYRIELYAEHAADKLTLHSAKARFGPGTLALAGSLSLSEEKSFTATGSLARFDPALLGDHPPATINAEFSAEGELAPQARGSLRFSVHDSEFNRQPVFGQGKLELEAKQHARAKLMLAIADNRIEANGDFGPPHGQLRWRIDAPRLEAISPALGGALRASGTLRGGYEKPALDFVLGADRLKLPGGYAIARVDGRGKLNIPADGALNVAFDLTGLRAQQPLLDTARLNVAGTLSEHTLNVSMRGPKLDLAGELSGGWHEEGGWTGLIRRFQNAGVYQIALLSPAPLAISPNRVSLATAAFGLADGTLTIEQLEKQGAHFATRGEGHGLALARLLQWLPQPPPLETTLTLAGDWSLSAAETLDGHLVLRREGGDVTLPTDTKVPMGLERLEVDAWIETNRARLKLELSGTRLGRVAVDGSTVVSRDNGNWGLGGGAPLALKAETSVESLSGFGLLGNAELETGGRLQMRLNGAGTLAQPQLHGYVRGEALSAKLIEQGIALKDGTFEADFVNDRVLLKTFAVHAGEGDLRVNGEAFLGNTGPRMGLDFKLARLAVLSRPDRELVASGAGVVTLQDQQLSLEGKIKTDRALIELPDFQAPILSQDVAVVGAEEKTGEKPAPLAAKLDISFDLGEEFYVKGKGLDAKLSGLLSVRGSGQGTPLGYGSINVVKGSFSAYGQDLTIQQGVVNFSGPIDNPGLNLLAVRKDPAIEAGAEPDASQVKAGVKVTGTALAPQVTLVSTPEVPDGEKLAWLVLGHGLQGSSKSEFDLLGTAANALLARGESVTLQARIAQALGLSELRLEGGGQLHSTVAVLGKKLSARTYLTFEQSLRGASRSLAKLRYELTPRWSVQAASGTENAVDLFYTLRFD